MLEIVSFGQVLILLGKLVENLTNIDSLVYQTHTVETPDYGHYCRLAFLTIFCLNT